MFHVSLVLLKRFKSVMKHVWILGAWMMGGMEEWWRESCEDGKREKEKERKIEKEREIEKEKKKESKEEKEKWW